MRPWVGPRIGGAIIWSPDRNRTEMDRKKCGGCLVLRVIIIILVIKGALYFSAGKDNQISEKIEGNSNQISSQQRSEISLLHVENLGSTVENLDERMKTHATVKYSLLLIIFIFIIAYAANKCYKMPKRIKQRMEKESQEGRITDNENALIEMGYLRPKTKKRKKQSQVGQKVKP